MYCYRLFIVLGILGISTCASGQELWQAIDKEPMAKGYHIYHDLAVNPANNQPYVAFEDDGNDITVMKFSGDKWELVGNAEFSDVEAHYINIAFQPGTNVPYVAYKYLEGTTVRKFDGSSWVVVGKKEFRSDDDAFSYHQSLAFAPNSRTPYVAYQEKIATSSDDTRVMKFDGTEWVEVGTAIFSKEEADYQQLAFPPSKDVPYVLYNDYNITEYGGIVKKFNGNNWVTVGKERFTEDGIGDTDLVFSSSGVPYIAYSSFGQGATVMKYNGNKWVLVGSKSISSDGSSHHDLSFSSAGNLYIGYEDHGNGDKASVKKFNGNKWVTVGKTGVSDGEADQVNIALHPSKEIPYVAFYDDKNGGTTVMDYDELDCPTYPKPEAGFSFSNDRNTGKFNNQSRNATKAKWYFGDNTTDTQLNPDHKYDTSGTYEACLIAKNICKSDTICKTVEITCPQPVSKFNVDTNGLEVKFFNTSEHTKRVKWTFGDGETAFSEFPQHEYDKEGDYTVCLRAFNGCGASDSSCKRLTVKGKDDNSGLAEVSETKPEVRYYPNPAASGPVIFRYELDAPGDVRFTIYSSKGKKLKTVVNRRQRAGTHRLPVDMEGVKAGSYIYRLRTPGTVQTGKFLVK